MDSQKFWNAAYWIAAIPAMFALHKLWLSLIEKSWFFDVLPWVLSALVLFATWLLLRRASDRMVPKGPILPGGVYLDQNAGATFADVGGADEAKEALSQLVAMLRIRDRDGRASSDLPKGVLLIGPAGTGKTLLARALAGEAGVPFLSVCGFELIELFAEPAQAQNFFEHLRRRAPAVLFIDELEAVGGARHCGAARDPNPRELALAQLLIGMDSLDARSGVLVIAATRHPEILDPALLRAGRFERQVLVDLPDRRSRLAILKVHSRRASFAPGLHLDQIAARTLGFSGADLADLVHQAVFEANRRGGGAVTMEDFDRALERSLTGLGQKRRPLKSRERYIAAYHEMGHAVLGLALPGVMEAGHKVSIIPGAMGALGWALVRPADEGHLKTRDELEREICVLLGGCAAEQLQFGRQSTAAGDDLARATAVARSMVACFGMEPSVGRASFEPEPAQRASPASDDAVRVSEVMLHRIDKAVQAIVEGCFERAQALLAAHRDVLNAGAQALLESEILRPEELKHIGRTVRAIDEPLWEELVSQSNVAGASSIPKAAAETSAVAAGGW